MNISNKLMENGVNGKKILKKGDKRQLKTPQDLRLFLASLIRRVESGEIEESKGRCLTYMTQVLMNVIRDSDIEKRIEELEKTILKGE